MRIIADSGSTKCTWLLCSQGNTTRTTTEGINASLHAPEQIRETLARLPLTAPVGELWFYGAGCGASFPAATERLRSLLAERFPGTRIALESDLTAAARALFARGEGIACILGTGSNSCHCRGGETVATVPPLGYILGDEGSGAALGRELVNALFKGRIPLREAFLERYGLGYEELIRRVYREPGANRLLASFAPFVREHTDLKAVHDLVVDAFRAFALRNLAAYPAHLPLGFVGGIAAHFGEELHEAMESCGHRIARIVESPADGLLEYHHEA